MKRTPMKRSRGTSFPAAVVNHVREHQDGCIGPMAGMPGDCSGGIQNDHVRASGGFGMKSIAVNCARLCGLTHHPMKTEHGTTYRPLLLAAIARLHGECARCQREAIVTYGAPLETVA